LGTTPFFDKAALRSSTRCSSPADRLVVVGHLVRASKRRQRAQHRENEESGRRGPHDEKV